MALVVLSAGDVSRVSSELSPNELMALMAHAFARLHLRDRIDMPHRLSISAGTYSALFMPARVEGFGSTLKTVSLPSPGSQASIQATTLVLDEQTGAVRAVVNATGLTALRTAAGSALATRLLGPASPQTLVAFGAGRQILAHLDLLIRTLPSIKHCTIVNRSRNTQLEALRANLQKRFGNVTFNSELLDSPQLQAVVSSADIICTATPSTKPLFKSDWIKSGAHINLVGSYTPEMAEVDEGLIKRAGKILVDSREACLAEAGELINARLAPENLIEVGETVGLDGTEIPERLDAIKMAGDITIFKSVGVGIQDTIITTAVLDKAISLRIGVQIPRYEDEMT